MTAVRTASIYSPEMLSLAMELADYPFHPSALRIGHARSRTCGSEIRFSCATDGEGRIMAPGLQVTACAVGQASAAIFVRDAVGMDRDAVEAAMQGVENWLQGAQPDIPLPFRLELLAPARRHRARHEAILLPWRAALASLSNALGPR